MHVVDAVKRLLGTGEYTTELLELELGVATGTIANWLSGEHGPRPDDVERLARVAARSRTSERTSLLDGHAPHVAAARQAVEQALRMIREALHRRGRLSSRNEALDEVSRLLFAHVVSKGDRLAGISAAALNERDEVGLPARLRGLVRHLHERHLPDSLAHELSAADFALRIKDSETALAQDLVEAFEALDAGLALVDGATITGLDLLNDAFGRFMADSFTDEKELGQYLTPPEVVQFMVRLALAHLTPAERDLLRSPETCHDFGAVLDPSCGVGSFLTEFVRTAQTAVAPTDPAARDAWTRTMCTDVVIGIDKSERMIRLALAASAMFGFPTAQLHLASALTRTGPQADVTGDLQGRVALILTNPPFGATFSGGDLQGYHLADDWATRPPSSIDSELLFCERYLDWLRPGGQLVAVLPDSILTNKGLFGDLRRGLAPHVDLVSVTSLPPVTFAAAGTTTKTSVVHWRKRERPGARTTPTAFAICDDIGFTVSTRGSQRTQVRTGHPGDLPDALCDLSASPVRARLVDDVENQHRWDATYHASLPEDLDARIRRRSGDDVLLGEVADLAADRIDPRRGPDDTFAYIEISDVDPSRVSADAKVVRSADAPSRARKLVRAGDVLVSTVRPERRAVAVVRAHQNGAVCTTGFAVLRPTGISAFVLARLLQSEQVTAQLLRNNVGIAYPAIEENCLLDVLLPISRRDLTLATDAADAWIEAEQQLRERQQAFDQIIGKLGDAWAQESDDT